MICENCNTKVINWKISKRKHKRPPRVFVTCPHCGAEFQAVPKYEKINKVFRTGKLPSGKKQRNYRLTDEGDKFVKKLMADGIIK